MYDADSAIARAVQRIRSGETDVLAELFAHYRNQLKKMVDFRLDPRLAGRVDPSDVVQEAYIDAAKRIDHFVADDVSFLVWIRQITEQTMIDVHRRHLGTQKRDVRREVALKPAHISPPTSACMLAHLLGKVSSPSNRVQRGEVSAQIERALEAMDPIDREVLALRHFEELTNNQVAEVLRLQPSAASNRYFRALKRLKAILEQLMGPDSE